MKTTYLRLHAWEDKDDYKMHTFAYQGIWVHYSDQKQLDQIKKNVAKAVSEALRQFDTSDYIHELATTRDDPETKWETGNVLK